MTMIAAEGPEAKTEEIVIVTNADEVSQPCGGCRQQLVEFGTELIVNCMNDKGKKTRHTMDELLPLSFGPHSFKPKAKIQKKN